MKNRISGIFLCTVLALCLLIVCAPAQGCGDNDEVQLDINAFSADMLGQVSFDGELEPISREMAGVLYGLDDSVAAVVCLGGSGSADELAVFDAGTSDAAALLLAVIRERNADQAELYADYAPLESGKLEDAVILQTGQYVIYCVSSDAQAGKTIENYLSK